MGAVVTRYRQLDLHHAHTLQSFHTSVDAAKRNSELFIERADSNTKTFKDFASSAGSAMARSAADSERLINIEATAMQTAEKVERMTSTMDAKFQAIATQPSVSLAEMNTHSDPGKGIISCTLETSDDHTFFWHILIVCRSSIKVNPRNDDARFWTQIAEYSQPLTQQIFIRIPKSA
jgi:hypothetical protein